MIAQRIMLAAVAILAGTCAAGAVLYEGPRGWDETSPAFWIERQLDLIRRDRPLPTVHARNLFHVSAAMYDSWTAFDAAVPGLLVQESTNLPPEPGLMRVAMGSAAVTMLRHRYALTNRDGLALLKFESTLREAGLLEPLDGQEAVAQELGTRVAQAIIKGSLDDGANELDRYFDTSGYRPVNAPMDPWTSGTALRDPDRWQQIVVYGRTQRPATPFWSDVRPFAIERPDDGSPYFDPGPPPRLNEAEHAELAASLVELIMLSSCLDGYSSHPEADLGRVMAEYWEDGPSSETPPGHWNLFAMEAAERTGPPRETSERLAWEVRLFAVLNATLHDAAIACWDVKYHYDSVRPISLIRYMGQLGQSSDPNGQSYHPLGLPLVPDLIELVTEASSAEGGPHAGLRPGEIAIYCWRGNPANRNTQISGVAWIPAVSWLPYQDADFITPAFPGYPSGHSTYSTAAAKILSEYFGSDEIPGGGFEFVAPAEQYLSFERGPMSATRLSWPRFSEAADQAGRSRLWGGIHPWFDDDAGRRVGLQVAELVLERFDQGLHLTQSRPTELDDTGEVNQDSP